VILEGVKISYKKNKRGWKFVSLC